MKEAENMVVADVEMKTVADNSEYEIHDGPGWNDHEYSEEFEQFWREHGEALVEEGWNELELLRATQQLSMNPSTDN